MEMGALCVCTWRGEDGNALFACEWRVSRLFCIFRKAQTLQINISAAKKKTKNRSSSSGCAENEGKMQGHAAINCHYMHVASFGAGVNTGALR